MTEFIADLRRIKQALIEQQQASLMIMQAIDVLQDEYQKAVDDQRQAVQDDTEEDDEPAIYLDGTPIQP